MKIFYALLMAAVFGAGIVHRAPGFSLLGPLQNQANRAADPWQGKPYGGRHLGLGYSLPGDIGGPMLIHESYRWNIPVITYGFDPEFVQYFGQAGVDEVEKAIAIFNALPPASEMSATLEEFRLDTKQQNGSAEVLQLLDLKSHALALLLEQLGLAMPERFVWCLRARNASAMSTNYVVLNLNYDPISGQASQRVNGVLYNYEILDALGRSGEEWASAVEWFWFDPDFVPYSSVASALGGRDFELGPDPGIGPVSGLRVGQFFTGLTRDDVGGLRFLLSRENKRWEELIPGISGLASNSANFVNVALRPGVEKLTFQRQQFNEGAGRFHPVTNIFQDIYFTNGVAATQTLQRVVATPDILFRVRDLGGTVYQWELNDRKETLFAARLYDRSDTSAWMNHASLNARPGGAGPGVIRTPVHITFNNLGRYATAGFVSFLTPLFAAFDGSAVPPVWFSGSDTNINSLVVEARLVRTNEVVEFEWTTLKSNHDRYRVEVSTNLVDWTLFNYIEPDLGHANAFSLRHPIGDSPRFFRSIKEPWTP